MITTTMITSNIEKHEKAIRLLEAIDRLDYRIEDNSKYYQNRFYVNRVKIDTKIKERLTNYYNQKLIKYEKNNTKLIPNY